jgi:hypothetical protein
MESELDTLTRNEYLDFFATDDGLDLLAAFERQHQEKRKRLQEEEERHRVALADARRKLASTSASRSPFESAEKEATADRSREHVFVPPCRGDEHVDTALWDEKHPGQLETENHVRGADTGCETSRASDGDVVMGNGMKISYAYRFAGSRPITSALPRGGDDIYRIETRSLTTVGI